MDSTPDEATRSGLRALTATGDLLDLAREMRQMGVESLLFCRPDGRITRMLTDRQIAHLAATPGSAELIPEQERRRQPPEPATDPQPVRSAKRATARSTARSVDKG